MQDVHVVRCRAVQGLVAGQPVVAATRVAAFDSAANSSRMGFKNRPFRAVPGLNPARFGVNVPAGAKLCGAVGGGVAVRGRGWVGPTLGGGPGEGLGGGKLCCACCAFPFSMPF